MEKQAETAAAEEKPKSGRTEGDARTYADNAICLEHLCTHFTQGTYYMGTKVQNMNKNTFNKVYFKCASELLVN